jgi:hypothetical protein
MAVRKSLAHFTILLTTLTASSVAWAAESKEGKVVDSVDLTHWYAQASLSSWQENLTLSGLNIHNAVTGSNQVSVLADPIGLCLGAGYREHFRPNLSWDVNSCLFLGRASGFDSSSLPAGVSYNSKDQFSIGLQNAVGILWNPSDSKHQLGLAIPVILNHVSWPSSSGASVSPSMHVDSGVLIESRFYSNGNFCFDPKLAWLQTSHSVLWSLNFTVDLL